MIHQMVFDPTDLRNLGAVFDDAWNSILSQASGMLQSVRSCVFGSRRWCFAWQLIINSARSRSKRQRFAY